jgi:hypothetical protein
MIVRVCINPNHDIISLLAPTDDDWGQEAFEIRMDSIQEGWLDLVTE